MGTDILHVAKCASCSKPIYDRFVMQVSEDEVYHESCLICSVCRINLVQTCYTRNSKIYCRFDYERLYGKKCLGCLEKIPAEEFVMRASEFVFHLRCFVCVVCGIRLQKGDQFVIKQGQLFCRTDYEKEVEMMQGFLPGEFSYEDGLITRSKSHDGRRGPKRPRTILTTQQRRAFKASFEISPKPCRKVRETLAKDTGLSVRIVQVWFQNQRAKIKKIQKKAKSAESKSSSCSNNTSSNGSDSSDGITSNENNNNFKQEKILDNVPISTYINHDYANSNHSCNGKISMKDDLSNDSSIYYKPLIDQEDGYNSSSIFSSQTNYHKSNEDNKGFVSLYQNGILDQDDGRIGSYNRGGLLNNEENTLVTGMMLNNPIDRLYSMQTTYFCAENSVATAGLN